MANTKTEQTGEVQVLDAAGQPHTLLINTTYIEFRGLSGVEWMPDRKAYTTESGDPVNPLKNGNFQVVLTDQILRPA